MLTLVRTRIGVKSLVRFYHESTGTSVEEISHFNALASSWWDVNGPQRILHKMNLLRMDFIRDTIKNNIKLNEPGVSPEDEVYIPPYNVDLLPDTIKQSIINDQDRKRSELLSNNKLAVLDVGCGGGILCESMARLPFIKCVKGIDLSSEVIEAANIHKSKDLDLKDKLVYELQSLEAETQKFDIITLFEILEHVDYPSKVLTEALDKLNPNGWLFLSTINRDLISWFTTIFMGEHVMRIVPVGTHSLDKYINHDEIKQWISKNPKFKVMDSKGCIYVPSYGWKFTTSENLGNYFMAIKRIH